jgi:hypothetical protein
MHHEKRVIRATSPLYLFKKSYILLYEPFCGGRPNQGVNRQKNPYCYNGFNIDTFHGLFRYPMEAGAKSFKLTSFAGRSPG